MTDAERTALLEKNQRIIDMVIERAKREFPDDIAIVGLTGSFSTGDFHAKSDLDLIIINDTPRGWGISLCFILGDVGYDIYCTPWETRIDAQSKLESPMVSCLVDLQILYCAKPEYMERFDAYRQRALDALSKPIGPDCLYRAGKFLDAAKARFADAMMAEGRGRVRYWAGRMAVELLNAVVAANNTYLKRGIKRYREQFAALEHRPEAFLGAFDGIVGGKTVEDIRAAAREALRSAGAFLEAMSVRFAGKKETDEESLKGTYEEYWCNYRNKVIAATEAGDPAYAFLAGMDAQSYLDEMITEKGTPGLELMDRFDSGDLDAFRDAFLDSMNLYLDAYRKHGLSVERFGTFEELYRKFLRR